MPWLDSGAEVALSNTMYPPVGLIAAVPLHGMLFCPVNLRNFFGETRYNLPSALRIPWQMDRFRMWFVHYPSPPSYIMTQTEVSSPATCICYCYVRFTAATLKSEINTVR